MEIAEIITIVTGAITIAGTITGVIAAIKKIFAGQRCLLRAEMLRVYYHHCDKEEIRQYEYENFVMMYEAYKKLHGNSFMDKIYDEVRNWRVTT